MSEAMNISFTPQLGRAWQRMKAFLFQPFDLGRWFVLGFTAFLVHLDSGGGGGNSGIQFRDKLDRHHVGEWTDTVSEYYEEILSNAWLIMLAGFVLLVGIFLGILFLWLSSRGRFMLLDNLVQNRTEVKRPWTQYAAQGDSLFRWQLVFMLVCFLVFGLFGGAMLLLFLPLGLMGLDGIFVVPLVVLAGALGFALIVTIIYIEFFLHNFVVTIMYRERISTTEAWARFKPLFNQHPGSLVGYGLFYLLVSFAGAMALLMGGVLTCCLGLFLLALPYIGSVVSLPLTVTLRFWDLEFLGQFGPQFQVLGPLPTDPDHRSIYDDGDGTVVGPEDLGEDPGGSQTGPQDL